jgi:hypothetical protein
MNNIGKQKAWDEMYADGTILPDTYKVWSANFGACPICLEFNGEAVPVTQPFSNGDQQPEAHPNCRCTAEFETDEEYSARTGMPLFEEVPTPPPPSELPKTRTPDIDRLRGFERGAYNVLPKDKASEHFETIALTPRVGDLLPRGNKMDYLLYSDQRKYDQIYATKGTNYINGGVTITVVDKIPKAALTKLFETVDNLMERNPLPLVHIIVHRGSMARYDNQAAEAMSERGGITLVTQPSAFRELSPQKMKKIIESEWFVPSFADDPVKHTLAHEWGHLLDRDKLAREITEARLKEMGETLISRYGRTKVSETYAEAYAEWFLTNGKTNNPFIIEMAERFGW